MESMDECSGPPDECKPFAKKKQPKPKRRMKSVGEILDIKVTKPKPKTPTYERQSSQNVRNLSEATNVGTAQDDFALKSMKKSAKAGNEPYAAPKWKRKN